jgi:hypothetical protein
MEASDNPAILSRITAWLVTDRFHRLLACIASALFFLFAAYRTFSVPFTHDESFSYLEFVEPHTFKEVLCQPANSSGNHLLNTLFQKVVLFVLPPNDWTLRMPNLLAYALFLYAAFRVCRHLFRPPYHVAVFILLNLNMFLLQFFSLARGYGLAFSFMMTSIWFFLQSLDSEEHRSCWNAAALGAAVLACFANISFLNYYCALLLIGTLTRFRDWKRIKPFSKSLPPNIARILTFWDSLITVCILAITLIPFAFNLRKLNQFYYGRDNGFLVDTVFTLVKAYLYEDSGLEALLPSINLGICFLLAILFVFYAAVPLISRKDLRIGKAVFLYWIMFVSAIAIVIQHHALGTLYPIDRAALFFVPMFVLSMAGLIAWEGNRWRILMRYKTGFLFTVILGLAAWQFSRVANVSYAIPWKFDANTTVMLNDLQAVRLADGKPGPIRLGVTVPLSSSVSFYAKIKGLGWLEKVDRDGIENRILDYYYIVDEDLDYAESAKASILKYYPLSKTWLMRPPQQ